MSFRYTAGYLTASYNPLLVPNAPTIGTATGGNASASVTFTAPTNVGGGAITSYLVLSSGGQTASGSSSPITVTGLTNGVSYTFVVFAVNAYGAGPASASSNSVTPAIPTFLTNLYASNPSGGGSSVTTDSSDNIYAYGYNASNQMEVAKYDSSGALQWQRSVNISNYYGRITIDSASNVILISNDTTNIFLIKLDSSGSLVWQKSIPVGGGSPSINAVGVTADSSNNIYISCSAYRSAYNHLLIKLDSSGSHQFTRVLATGYRTDISTNVSLDSSGNIYLASAYNVGYYAATLIKYDSGGTLQWQRTVFGPGGNDSSYFYDVTCDSSNNVYACGKYAPGGGYQAEQMLVKYDSSGNLQWNRKLNIVAGYGLDVDAYGNVYVCGYNSSYAMVMSKYNSSGTIQWQRQITGSSRNCYGYDVKVDSLGNPIFIGTSMTTSATDSRFLIAKIPADGSKTGTYTLSGTTLTYSAASQSDSSFTATYGTSAGGSSSTTLSINAGVATVSTSSLTTGTVNLT